MNQFIEVTRYEIVETTRQRICVVDRKLKRVLWFVKKDANIFPYPTLDKMLASTVEKFIVEKEC